MYVNSETIRITLEVVVREHLTAASDLFLQLHEGAFRLDDRHCFEDLCCRLEANIDAVRIAGNGVASVIRCAGLEEDSGIASVLSLLLAESEAGKSTGNEQVTALLRDENPDVRQAASSGLRLAVSRHVEPHLRALLGELKWNFVSAAALHILAFHRLLGQCDLGLPVDEENDDVSWMLAEAGGRMRSVGMQHILSSFLVMPRRALASLLCGRRQGVGCVS